MADAAAADATVPDAASAAAATTCWDASEIAYLQGLASEALEQSRVYQRVYEAHKRKEKWYVVPSIVLSSVVSVSSIASQLLPGDGAKYVPVVVGFLSLAVTMLTSIQAYFGISATKAVARQVHTQLLLLHQAILKELALSATCRGTSPTGPAP